MQDKRHRILVTEDDSILGELLVTELSQAGYHVTLVADGAAACEMLSKKSFDLVLLDLLMPVMNGYGVMQYMKEQGIPTPVIVLSNINSPEDIQNVKLAGAKEFLTKADIDIDDLIRHVQAHIH